MKYISICALAFVGLIITACSYQQHNPENELKYLRYWGDPKNRENSIISIFEDDKPWEHKTISQKECLEKTGYIGN